MDNDMLVITPKPLKGEDGFKTFSIRIREDIIMQLDTMSQTTGRSRNELISILLEYALSRCVISDVSPKK